MNSVIYIESSVIPDSVQLLNLRGNKLSVLYMDLLTKPVSRIYMDNNRILGIVMDTSRFTTIHVDLHSDSIWINCLFDIPNDIHTGKCEIPHFTTYLLTAALVSSVLLIVFNLLQVFLLRQEKKEGKQKDIYFGISMSDLMMQIYLVTNTTLLLMYREKYIKVNLHFISTFNCLLIKVMFILAVNCAVVIDFIVSAFKCLTLNDPFLKLKVKLCSKTQLAFTFLPICLLSIRLPSKKEELLILEKEMQYPLCFASTFTSGMVTIRDMLTGLTMIVAVLSYVLNILSFCIIQCYKKPGQDGAIIRKNIITCQISKQFINLIIVGMIKTCSLVSLICILRDFRDIWLGYLVLYVSAFGVAISNLRQHKWDINIIKI